MRGEGGDGDEDGRTYLDVQQEPEVFMAWDGEELEQILESWYPLFRAPERLDVAHVLPFGVGDLYIAAKAAFQRRVLIRKSVPGLCALVLGPHV